MELTSFSAVFPSSSSPAIHSSLVLNVSSISISSSQVSSLFDDLSSARNLKDSMIKNKINVLMLWKNFTAMLLHVEITWFSTHSLLLPKIQLWTLSLLWTSWALQKQLRVLTDDSLAWEAFCSYFTLVLQVLFWSSVRTTSWEEYPAVRIKRGFPVVVIKKSSLEEFPFEQWRHPASRFMNQNDARISRCSFRLDL